MDKYITITTPYTHHTHATIINISSGTTYLSTAIHNHYHTTYKGLIIDMVSTHMRA